MITMYLSPRSLEAARAVDPYISPAAVHAAVEIAVAEQLRAVADRGPDEIRAWAAAIEQRADDRD
ncbi:MAG: hypothetical protein ACXWYP_08705 [Pseudonocardia sp.]